MAQKQIHMCGFSINNTRNATHMAFKVGFAKIGNLEIKHLFPLPM